MKWFYFNLTGYLPQEHLQVPRGHECGVKGGILNSPCLCEHVSEMFGIPVAREKSQAPVDLQ